VPKTNVGESKRRHDIAIWELIRENRNKKLSIPDIHGLYFVLSTIYKPTVNLSPRLFFISFLCFLLWYFRFLICIIVDFHFMVFNKIGLCWTPGCSWIYLFIRISIIHKCIFSCEPCLFSFFVFAEHALTKKKLNSLPNYSLFFLREGWNFHIFNAVYMLPGQLKTKSKLSCEWRTVLLL
jgi:hypothetical protein